jgi:hypothetical protein
MNNITIGYLSWRRQNILEQTLKSHRDNGIFDIIPHINRFIFFQEISDKDIIIANKFDCEYIGNRENIGILNAFIKMVEHCKSEYFIFCENDWYLIENKFVTSKILEDSIQLLENNKCDIVKLRHRQYHGEPLYSKPINIENWLSSNCYYKLESLSWLAEPNVVYNNIMEEYNGNYKWYITNLQHQRWSNNVFIAKTSYLKENILPLLKYFIEDNNKYTGLENILINYKNYIGKNRDIDNIINKYSNTKIAGGEGLFMHRDK